MTYYLKKYWTKNAAAVALQILCHGITAALNVLQILSFQGIIERDFRRFLFWELTALAGWALYLLCSSVQTMLQARAVRAMNNQVRRDMAATLLGKSHMDYHAKDSGEYLSWLTNGVEQIEQLAWDAFFSLTAYTAQIVTSIVALAALHWSLVAASLLSAVLMIAAPKLFEKQLERLGADCAQAHAAASGRLKDLLEGYDTLCAFGRRKRFSGGVEEASDQIELPQYRRACRQGFIYGGIGFVNVIAQCLVNFYIGVLSIRGTIIQSALMGGGNLCAAISNGLNQLAYYRLCFSTSKPYFERITVHAGEDQPAPIQPCPPAAEAVTVENVSFSYGSSPVLRNLSVRFAIGGKYALTGPSGCGKSTLLKLLLGWLPDYEGRVCFDGRDVRSLPPEQLQRQISYIAQDVFLFNTTIRDNITLGGTFTEEQLEQAIRGSALSGDLTNLPEGLDTSVGERGSCLSGGQRQRVAIARALLHNSHSILLVDEGTSALDRENADIVEESLLANGDITLILVSHHLTPARKKEFDRVYELQTAAKAV